MEDEFEYVDTVTYGAALKRAFENNGIMNTVAAANELGVSQPTATTAINDKRSPTINTALDQLSHAGYTLAAVPAGSKLPEGSMLLRPTNPKKAKAKRQAANKEESAQAGGMDA